MRACYSILFVLMLCASVSFAQPRWSPEVRAERETNWVRDSLHISADKLKKIGEISLAYNHRMDSVNDTHDKNKEKIKQKLMQKKDSDFKALLTKAQYQRYYKREKLIRQRENIQYKGRQPY